VEWKGEEGIGEGVEKNEGAGEGTSEGMKGGVDREREQRGRV
jgi:hypothetical protein